VQIPILLFFDDGYKEDLIVADMLAERGLKATFAIPLKNLGLLKNKVLKLASVGEIASHGVSHLNMVRLLETNPLIAYQELYYSRIYLEKLTMKPITTFVYPYGIYNAKLRNFVIKAGYRCARTVDQFNTSKVVNDLYRIPITLIDYPPSVQLLIRSFPNLRNRLSLFACHISIRHSYSYSDYLANVYKLITRAIVLPANERQSIAISLVFHSNRCLSEKNRAEIFERILNTLKSKHFQTLTMQEYIKEIVENERSTYVND